MNRKTGSIVLGICALAVFALLVVLVCRQAPAGADTAAETPAVQSPTDDAAFSPAEKEAMLDNLRRTVEDIEIFDYTFGDKNSAIYLAAACKDLNTGLESGLAYVTEFGVGYVALATDVPDFVYLTDEGIKLSPDNVVSLSLRNTATGEISDYEVAFSRVEQKLDFVIHSTVRTGSDAK